MHVWFQQPETSHVPATYACTRCGIAWTQELQKGACPARAVVQREQAKACDFVERAKGVIEKSFAETLRSLEHWLPEGDARKTALRYYDIAYQQALKSLQDHEAVCENIEREST